MDEAIFKVFDDFYSDAHDAMGKVADLVDEKDLDGHGNGLCDYMDFLISYEVAAQMKRGNFGITPDELMHKIAHRVFEFAVGFAIQKELR